MKEKKELLYYLNTKYKDHVVNGKQTDKIDQIKEIYKLIAKSRKEKKEAPKLYYFEVTDKNFFEDLDIGTILTIEVYDHETIEKIKDIIKLEPKEFTPMEENVEITQIDDDDEHKEQKLRDIYNNIGYKIGNISIDGVDIRAPYPHEVGLTEITIKDETTKTDKKYKIIDKNTNSKDYYQKYLDKKKEIINKKSRITNSLSLLGTSEKAIKDNEQYFLTKDDLDNCEKLCIALKDDESVDKSTGRKFKFTVSGIKVHPLFYRKKWEIEVSNKNANRINDLIYDLGGTTKIETVRKKEEDKDRTVYIRRKLNNESIEDYEKYLRLEYLRKGLLKSTEYTDDIRICYPHEKSNRVKNNLFKIVFEDGLNPSECLAYYNTEYLSTKIKVDKEEIIGKDRFLNDTKKIRGNLFTTIPLFQNTEFKDLLKIIADDKTDEASTELNFDITISCEKYPKLINNIYKFKVSEETFNKINNATFKKYFNIKDFKKTKDPLSDTIYIRKRKSTETIEQYEEYLKKEVYDKYPIKTHSVTGIREKHPHEKGNTSFITDGKAHKIVYGDPTDPNDMAIAGTEEYKKSIKEHYKEYYISKISAIAPTTPIDKTKDDFLKLLKDT